MRICVAQMRSEKGEVEKNINHHLEMVDRAAQCNSDLIVFPELSITNYEPELANKLATTINNNLFVPFQDTANKKEIVIGVGMPTKTENGINISLLIFSPNQPSKVYSKQLLHSDELPYFVEGQEQTILEIKGHKIGLGICYESLQPEHFTSCNQLGAEVYIASVAKPQGGVEKAYTHFPQIAKEYSTPILMANAVGKCDNFLSMGQSAVWSSKGELMEQLDTNTEGLIVFDLETNTVRKEQ